jgi:enoyl-CoA hydratase/carnithine racemase
LERETVIEDGIAVLTLSRPEQRNAFNDPIYDELRDAARGRS